MSYNSPSIANLLIATLCSGRSIKAFYRILREREFQKYKKESVQVALSRLHKKGYLENLKSGWRLTKEGNKHEKEVRLLSYIPSPFKKDSPSALIVSFDIKETDRFIRRWLRAQLKIFGYKMLQQSLWIGPGPLPASFLKRLEDLDVRKDVKTFRIVKPV